MSNQKYTTMYLSCHENKKVLTPFYHKIYFSLKIGVLHLFSIKKYFYNKMKLRLFYSRVPLYFDSILKSYIQMRI